MSEKGSGSYKNGRPIHVSDVSRIQNCTLSLIPVSEALEVKTSMLGKVAPQVFNIRIFGASVRNLTYLAEGIVDAVIEFDDKLWDFAAGISLVLEAGGQVSDHSGAPFVPEFRNYLASNGNIHTQMLQLMNN